MAVQLKGLVYDLPDSDYHRLLPVEEAFFSSSQFKDAVEDIEYFHKKYVIREISSEVSSTTQNNFDIGHAYHCLVSEPHKFEEGFAIYEGPTKRGKAYEAFCEENKSKKILTTKQMETVNFIVEANKKNTVAQDLLKQGQAEVSLFHVFHGLNVKVRADWISFEPRVCEKTGEVLQVPFIVDWKSTTGNPKLEKDIQNKISGLNYDLSAALYMDVFNDYLKSVGKPLIEEWKFCFDSKDTGTSKVWTASPELLKVGRAKYMRGIYNIKKAMAEGWNFKDTDSQLNPKGFDVQEWLGKQETLPPIPELEIEDEDLL